MGAEMCIRDRSCYMCRSPARSPLACASRTTYWAHLQGLGFVDWRSLLAGCVLEFCQRKAYRNQSEVMYDMPMKCFADPGFVNGFCMSFVASLMSVCLAVVFSGSYDVNSCVDDSVALIDLPHEGQQVQRSYNDVGGEVGGGQGDEKRRRGRRKEQR